MTAAVKKVATPFRLALRVEGNFWNAYFAMIDTMEGAMLLGSIRMAAVGADESIKTAFVALMQQTMELALREAGEDVDGWFAPDAAPEHEKAGHA